MFEDAPRTQCRFCQKQIVWIVEIDPSTGEPFMVDKGGRLVEKRIPVDPSAPCYQALSIDEAGVRAKRTTFAAVSHFKTCSGASKASRRKGKPGGQSGPGGQGGTK